MKTYFLRIIYYFNEILLAIFYNINPLYNRIIRETIY